MALPVGPRSAGSWPSSLQQVQSFTRKLLAGPRRDPASHKTPVQASVAPLLILLPAPELEEAAEGGPGKIHSQECVFCEHFSRVLKHIVCSTFFEWLTRILINFLKFTSNFNKCLNLHYHLKVQRQMIFWFWKSALNILENTLLCLQAWATTLPCTFWKYCR